MLKLLAQALSRALKLLLKATSREKSRVGLLIGFVDLQMLLLPAFAAAWERCLDDLDPAEAAASKQRALQQLQATGEQHNQRQHGMLCVGLILTKRNALNVQHCFTG